MALRFTTLIVDTANSNKSIGQSNKQFTQTGDNRQGGVIDVTTSEVTVTLNTDIGDAGAVYIRNQDTTNYVQVGMATGVYVHRIPPDQDERFWLEPGTASLFLIADTATCKVEFEIYER